MDALTRQRDRSTQPLGLLAAIEGLDGSDFYAAVDMAMTDKLPRINEELMRLNFEIRGLAAQVDAMGLPIDQNLRRNMDSDEVKILELTRNALRHILTAKDHYDSLWNSYHRPGRALHLPLIDTFFRDYKGLIVEDLGSEMVTECAPKLEGAFGSLLRSIRGEETENGITNIRVVGAEKLDGDSFIEEVLSALQYAADILIGEVTAIELAIPDMEGWPANWTKAVKECDTRFKAYKQYFMENMGNRDRITINNVRAYAVKLNEFVKDMEDKVLLIRNFELAVPDMSNWPERFKEDEMTKLQEFVSRAKARFNWHDLEVAQVRFGRIVMEAERELEKAERQKSMKIILDEIVDAPMLETANDNLRAGLSSIESNGEELEGDIEQQVIWYVREVYYDVVKDQGLGEVFKKEFFSDTAMNQWRGSIGNLGALVSFVGVKMNSVMDVNRLEHYSSEDVEAAIWEEFGVRVKGGKVALMDKLKGFNLRGNKRYQAMIERSKSIRQEEAPQSAEEMLSRRDMMLRVRNEYNIALNLEGKPRSLKDRVVLAAKRKMNAQLDMLVRSLEAPLPA